MKGIKEKLITEVIGEALVVAQRRWTNHDIRKNLCLAQNSTGFSGFNLIERRDHHLQGYLPVAFTIHLSLERQLVLINVRYIN